MHDHAWIRRDPDRSVGHPDRQLPLVCVPVCEAAALLLRRTLREGAGGGFHESHTVPSCSGHPVQDDRPTGGRGLFNGSPGGSLEFTGTDATKKTILLLSRIFVVI